MEQKPITPLLDALSTVSVALGNNSVKYNPIFKSHDNCGLLMQAITGTTKEELYHYYIQPMEREYTNKYSCTTHITWTDLMQEYWPLTSTPTSSLFMACKASGLNREDIPYLDKLSNPKILADSGINQDDIKDIITETEVKGRWFFSKKITVEKTVETKYYETQEALILYLVSWIKLLDVNNERIKANEIIVEGERYTYRNRMDLEKLKKHFLSFELYEGVTIVQEKLNNYK